MAEGYTQHTVTSGVHLFGTHRERFWPGNYRAFEQRFADVAEAMADKTATAYANACRLIEMIDLDRDSFAALADSEAPHWLVNMPVIELADAPGGLLVFSPVPLDAAGTLRAALDAMGTVRFVVAPHAFHTSGLASFREAYPEACFVCPKGTPLTGGQSLAELRPELDFEALLDDAASARRHAALAPLAAAGIDLDVVADNALNEIVLYHRASRTLVNSDIVYKAPGFEATPGIGGPTRPYIGPPWFAEAYQALLLDTSPSPLLPDNRVFLARHRMFDTAGFLAAYDRLLALDPAWLVSTHTDPLPAPQARDALQRSWGWLRPE